MAGPGKPGPPAKGEEEVEWQLLKAQVLDLRRQNKSFSEIGALVGMSTKAVRNLVGRIMRELLTEAGAEEVRAMEANRLRRIMLRLEPRLLPEDETQIPDYKAIESYLKLSTHLANLTGAFAPKSLELNVKQRDDDDDEASPADQFADRVERFMELADRFASMGYGSGRAPAAPAEGDTDDDDVVDAEVVDDPDADDWTESEDEVAPMNGSWVNGKFVPNPAALPAGEEAAPWQSQPPGD